MPDARNIPNWFGPDKRRPQDLGLPRDTTPEQARAIQARDTADLTVLLRLATDPDQKVRAAAYANPILDSYLLDFLTHYGDIELRPVLAAHQHLSLTTATALSLDELSVETAGQLLNRVPPRGSSDNWVPICNNVVAAHSDMSREVAERLVSHVAAIIELRDHPLRDVHVLLAQHEEATPSLLGAYVESGDAELVFLACSHPAWGEAEVQGFASDPRVEPRLAAAGHEKATVDVLVSLADSSQPDEVRRAVAVNPRLPGEVLSRLAYEYPVEVAGNPSCPASTLNNLAGLGDVEVQRSVASNPQCSEGMRRLLAGSTDEETRSAALRSLSAALSV